ncbi:MAG: family 43 glycosylhydrolase [Planctomycetia bacterium]|nr:family 43 glycosylhydrolase [Planctomycetia bacterium]
MSRRFRRFSVAPAVLIALALFYVGPKLQAAESRAPLDDAVAVWNMADLKDSAGKNSALTLHGAVAVGVKLPGKKGARGGDGLVAKFDGGFLEAGHGADQELDLGPRTMSVYLRARDPSGQWKGPLITRQSGPAKPVYRIVGSDASTGMILGANLATDGNNSLLQMRVPTDLVDATAWHDIVLRCDGAKVQLFVDGQWQDEDFLVGNIIQDAKAPTLIGGDGGFHGLIDTVAIWNRALSPDEIDTLSGGKEVVAARRAELQQKLAVPMQYYRPHHPDWNVGDCLPMFHDGMYHFLHLADKKHHGSKNGLGAHQWADVATTDLVHWDYRGLVVPITEQWEGSICTGSMSVHDGTYYAFYATRKADRSGEYLSLATSRDGIHFTKTQPNPFAGPVPPYVKGPFRDPNVFRDESTGLYHMLVTARLEKYSLAGRGDCLAHLVSRDLRSWDLKPDPFYIPGYTGAPECPDHFRWNDWYYLISSNHITARYRMSRNPLGPWTRPKNDMLGGPMEGVSKTAAYKDNRRIAAAWVGKDGWGGNAVFREVAQAADGTLSTRYPTELIPPTGDRADLTFQAITPGATGDGQHVEIHAADGQVVAALGKLPHNARITMKVTPQPGASYFSIGVRGTGDYAAGNEFRFSPRIEKVELCEPLSPPRFANEMRTLEGVEGLDKPFTVDIVLKNDLIDICIDNRRTMLTRTPELQGDRLFLSGHHADVRFDSIEVRPLK